VKSSPEISLVGVNFDLGQSGSKFSIVSTNSGTALMKSRVGDARFHRQFEKHFAAQSRSLGGMKTPSVLSSYKNDEYLMEILHAVPLGLGLNRMSLDQVGVISVKIANYFHEIFAESSQADEACLKLIGAKIELLDEFVHKQDNLLYSKAIELLYETTHWVSINQGWNHGDFSFENILVPQSGSDSNVYLIDFLDSPFESPMIDLGRFWLDLNYGWWGNKFSPSAAWKINNKVLRDNFLELIVALKIPFPSLYYFTLLASLRILPYTKNPVRLAHLKTSIDDIVKRSEEWQF